MRCNGLGALVLAGVLSGLLGACALVPKEAVELSSTVGRDIAAVHESHRRLATTLFIRMKDDVNRFVDDVYAPYQIQFVLARQKRRADEGNPNTLFSALNQAMRSPDDAQAQKDVITAMELIVQSIHKDVESYRQQRLAPVLAQEREVLAAVEQTYAQIQRGNAEVTAHLASVVKVHTVHDELLAKANLAGLRERVGVRLSDTSARLSEFVDEARKVDGSLEEAAAKVDEMTRKLDAVLQGEES